MSDAIDHKPSGTLCYCSSRAGAVLLDLDWCADCRGWLVHHSMRIVTDWVWWLEARWNPDRLGERTRAVDIEEYHDLQVFRASHHCTRYSRED